MPQLKSRPLLWVQAVALTVRMLSVAAVLHRAKPFDAIHAQWIVPAGLVARVLRYRFGVGYLVTSHGADATRLNRGAMRAVNRWVIDGAARFVGVSRDIATQFDGVHAPVSVQPTGIDFEYWATAARPRKPVPGRVLFVGRLTPKKGVADAIHAMAGLEGCELRIVGVVPLRRALEYLVDERGLASVVTFLGGRTRDEIAEEMRSAMCVVIPSVTAPDGDRDGTPNVLGEAIAAGVPVVASRIAGIREYIQNDITGLLHEPGDVAGLRTHIRRLTAGPEECLHLARAAQERAREHLDMHVVADRYTTWYHEAIKTTGLQENSNDR